MNHFGCILLGAPGSGKGTQAKIIGQRLSIPHISTGDILRRAIQDGSELGLKVKSIMSSGALVDDALMIELIRERFSKADVRRGYLLDGFPRTVAQAEALNILISELGFSAPKVLYLDVPEDLLIMRLTGRLTCEDCGAAFHKSMNKPKVSGVCDACGGRLVSRADDALETVKKRLEVYRLETEPLIEYYRQGGQMRALNGDQSMDSLATSMMKALEEKAA